MEHSPKYEKIKTYYNLGYWTEKMVQNAVKKGVITEEEAEEILRNLTSLK